MQSTCDFGPIQQRASVFFAKSRTIISDTCSDLKLPFMSHMAVVTPVILNLCSIVVRVNIFDCDHCTIEYAWHL